MHQSPAVPLAVLLDIGGYALSQDVLGQHWDLALPLLADEGDACGGGRELLASTMVSVHHLSRCTVAEISVIC
jgi:hypothetical protein